MGLTSFLVMPLSRACGNIELYATTWGSSGTYYDYVKEIAAVGISFSRLLNLDISREEVRNVLVESGFDGYRLKYGCDWICKTTDILKNI